MAQINSILKAHDYVYFGVVFWFGLFLFAVPFCLMIGKMIPFYPIIIGGIIGFSISMTIIAWEDKNGF